MADISKPSFIKPPHVWFRMLLSSITWSTERARGLFNITGIDELLARIPTSGGERLPFAVDDVVRAPRSFALGGVKDDPVVLGVCCCMRRNIAGSSLMVARLWMSG